MESHSSTSLLSSILIVLSLILVGGLFVAAEIALISLRESQIKQLAGRGRRGAKVAEVAANPNRLLAALQVGITVTGFLSAALGAEKLGVYVIPWLETLGLESKAANTTSLIGVTLAIAYISLVFGELVPKRLALYRTEAIALAVADIVKVLTNLFRPVVWILSSSTNLVVRLFGLDPKEQRAQISEEELLDLVAGHAALSDGKAKLGDLNIDVPASAGSSVIVGIRPEGWVPASTGFQVLVEVVEELGSDAFVYGKPADSSVKFANSIDEGAQVIVRWDPKNPPKAGETITVANLADAVHLFDATTGARLN